MAVTSSYFLVESRNHVFKNYEGCVCVNCEGLGIKLKFYASCLIFNACLRRVACSYHKEMTSHEWNWVLLVELKNLIYWISNCHNRLFCWKKCVFELLTILLDRLSWFCFAFEILCCVATYYRNKAVVERILVAASERYVLVFFLYPFAVNWYVLVVILCILWSSWCILSPEDLAEFTFSFQTDGT